MSNKTTPKKAVASHLKRHVRAAAPRARATASASVDGPASAGRERGGGVQSIERAFSILEEIARSRDGISLADLSKRVGLHNSTTFHLAKTMVALGYVRQLKDKRYRVGRPLFALAASSLDDVEMVSLATPVLEDLSRETGESAHFAVSMGGDTVVVIARTGGAGAFQLTDRVGVVRPAHCTALGKIILAAMRPEQLDRYLAEAELKAFTPKSITKVGALRREVAEVRRSGVAFDDGEFDPELRCVAVAVRDFTGRLIGALGISGPIWRLSIQTLQAHARLVHSAAERLSSEFGAVDHSAPP